MLTREEAQKDKVGGRLPAHRLAAGQRDEADEHHTEARPVHPHVGPHEPATKLVEFRGQRITLELGRYTVPI